MLGIYIVKWGVTGILGIYIVKWGVTGIRALTAKALALAARAHWAIENGLHWVLDVEFKEDQSRLRQGHGAKNMARVRHLALNLIRAAPGKISIKSKRKLATWDADYLKSALQLNPC